MQRREFLGLGALMTFGSAGLAKFAFAADAKKAITEKDILKEGQPATIANYCEHPEKQPNKFCPNAPKGATCKSCTFYNKDNSEVDYKGKKYARCQLLADPSKPQFVAQGAYCATYVKKT